MHTVVADARWVGETVHAELVSLNDDDTTTRAER